MDAHTVTVVFDDETLSPQEIVDALGAAGYAVPSFDPKS